jgi:hypothetical protein
LFVWPRWEWNITSSYLEIRDEVIHDLFVSTSESKNEKVKIVNEGGVKAQQQMKNKNKVPTYEIKHDGSMLFS